MDIQQLRAFVTVAHEGQLTRAAERLHVTQPAVSLQIKNLQDALQLTLFMRTGKGMQLTDEGAKLLPQAERVLAAVQELRQSAVALRSTLSGSLAIGTILDPEFIRLGSFLKRLVENYPQVSTTLRHGMSGWVSQQLKQAHLDIGYYLGDITPELHALTLTRFTYQVVAPQGWRHRVAGRDWAALAQLPWIWTPPESVHHRLLTAIFAQYRVTPHKVAWVDQEPSMLDLVKSGVGLSLVRESVALREAHVHGLTIVDSVHINTELSCVCLAERRHEPMIAAAFDLISEIWPSA